MEEKKTKRQGYSSKKAQNEANKRYLASNPEAKLKSKISSIRGAGKRFIKEFASLEELEELEILIKERKKILKDGI